jgi:hypothetical protein
LAAVLVRDWSNDSPVLLCLLVVQWTLSQPKQYWLVVWNIFFPHSVGNFIIPTPNWLSLHHFSEGRYTTNPNNHWGMTWRPDTTSHDQCVGSHLFQYGREHI